jgi:hypothetical protein
MVSDRIGIGHSVVDVVSVTAAVSRAKRQDATEEKKEYEACPFAGIIQIKFNGISQIESCQSNPRTPVMLHTKISHLPALVLLSVFGARLTVTANA